MVRLGEWSAEMHAPLAVNGLKHTKPLSVLKGAVGLEVWRTVLKTFLEPWTTTSVRSSLLLHHVSKQLWLNRTPISQSQPRPCDGFCHYFPRIYPVTWIWTPSAVIVTTLLWIALSVRGAQWEIPPLQISRKTELDKSGLFISLLLYPDTLEHTPRWQPCVNCVWVNPRLARAQTEWWMALFQELQPTLTHRVKPDVETVIRRLPTQSSERQREDEMFLYLKSTTTAWPKYYPIAKYFGVLITFNSEWDANWHSIK